MNLKYFLCGFLAVAAASGYSNAASPSKDHPPAVSQTAAHADTKHDPAKQDAVHHDEGERVFQQNCSRCHAAPEGFSPRISGTVVRHMRVRASLSKHDEQELLRFLNP